jgi:hypothetical protein
MQFGFLVLTLLILQGAAGTLIAEDSEGDPAYVDQQGTLLPVRGPVTEQIDLANLEVEETPVGLLVKLSFHDPGQKTSKGALSILLAHGTQTYELEIRGAEANLYSVDPASGQRRKISDLPLESNTLELISFEIPREYLLDETAAPPTIGTPISSWVVTAIEAQYGAGDVQSIRVMDRMPDAGVGSDFIFQTGELAEGGLRVYSPSPSRASNGASTSFLYPVFVENNGPSPKSVRLSLKEVPSSWDIQIAPSEFALDAGETLLIPVVVSIPFRHSHGDVEVATLKAEASEGAEGYAETSIRIHYYDIPQPTGHHDTLWIHAKASPFSGDAGDGLLWETRVQAIMNAAENDDESLEVPISGQPQSTVASDYRWLISLDPSLRMGLDFDLERTGLLSLELESPVPIQQGRIHGSLFLVKEEYVEIGVVDEILVALDANSPIHVTTSLRMHQEADFIAYDGAAELILIVNMDVGTPATSIPADAPQILPFSNMVLPLHEYRDPIEPIFLEKQAWKLSFDGDLQRNVNPGSALLFSFEVKNESPATLHPTLSVVGVHDTWANVLGGPTSPLEPGESAPFWVSIEVPRDAQQDMAADLFVRASSENTSPTFTRILALVDEEVSHPDDRQALESLSFDVQKTTPWPGLLVLIVLFSRRIWSE